MALIETLTALKAGLDAAKSAVELHDQAKIADAVRSLTDEYMALQMTCMELLDANSKLAISKSEAIERVSELEKQIDDSAAVNADVEANFEPITTAFGARVYQSKAPDKGSNARALLCANCASNGKKTFLQPSSATMGAFSCPNGHGSFRVH